MREPGKPPVYLLGNGAGMHDRIAGEAGAYETLEAGLADRRPLRIGVVRENAFTLDKVAAHAARLLGKSASVAPLVPSPPADLPRRFEKHLEDLRRALESHGIGIDLLDEELPAILDRAAALVPGVAETETLRLLGIVTRHVLVGPQWFVFEVENRCNEDCVYCNIHARGRNPAAADLSSRLPFETFKTQIDDLAQMGTDGVTVLANGEPTLHPRFIDMIENKKSKGLRVNFFTNGLLLGEKTARRIVDAGCDEMFCTISGGTKDGFLKLHPRQGPRDFDRLMDNLRFLHRYRREAGSAVPETFAVHVITHVNAHELVDMAGQAVDLGFDSLRPQMIRVDEHNFPLALTAADRERILSDLPAARKICAEGGVEMWAPFEAMVATASETPDNWTPDEFLRDGCPIGWSLGLAKSNGDLSLCCVVKPVGNLAEGSVRELWFGPEYHRFRLAALELDKNRDLPMRDGKPLFTKRCLRCDNHDINRRTFELLRKTGMIRFLKKAPGLTP